jgi:hypothetical protein
MWCTHNPKPMKPVATERQHHRRVAKHRPPRERGDDRRHHAERRHEDDVDLGMTEEPEQVLPEQRIAAFGRVVELRADQAIEQQERAREHHRRHREDDHEGHHQHRPDEQRQAADRHAGRARLENRRHQLHGNRQARHFGEGDQLRPEVRALAGTEFGSGQRHVGKPPDVRTGIEQHHGEEHHTAEQVHVVAERIEPGKRDVALPQHERHQIDPHPLHDRHGEQKHHRGAVHREYLVVQIRTEKAVVGHRELDAHQRGEHAGQREERECRHQIAAANGAVVHHRQRAEDALRHAPCVGELTMQLLVGHRSVLR